MYITEGRRFKKRKPANAYAYELAKKDVGRVVNVYKEGKSTPVHTVRLKYAEDDPVWEAVPNEEECRRLWLGVLLNTKYDHGRGCASGVPQDIWEMAGHSAFVDGPCLDLVCDAVGVCPDKFRAQLEK